jgi:glucose-1-phosphate thymidylyltransferase
VKALVLCAGKGTRLRPLTHTGAKHLIPVANKPILFYALEALAQAGVRDVALVVGDSYADIERAVRDGSQWGLSVRYLEQRDPRGLAHAVMIGREFIGDDRFIVYLGDNLFQHGVNEFVAENGSGCDAALMVHEVEDPRSLGVVEMNSEGRVVGVEEKPQEPKSNLAITGIYLFTPRIFDAIARIKPSARNELEITDAIQRLIDDGGVVRAHSMRGWWKDTGRPADVLDANRLLLEPLKRSIPRGSCEDSRIEGRVAIGPNTRVLRSTIRGPVMIADDCHIEGSFIGPFTAISRRSKIVNVEIENSIVMQNCQVINVRGRIDSTLLGKNVVLTRTEARPASHSFVLGDESQAFLA